MSFENKNDELIGSTMAKNWRELPPEKRPAIGETVEVIRGKYKGCRGVVKGSVPRGIMVEATRGPYHGAIIVMRHLLKDEDEKLMPEIISGEEAKRRKEQEKLEEEQAKQADRFYRAVCNKGFEFWDYCKDRLGLHSYEIGRLLEGEEALDEYMLDGVEEDLDVGIDWILYGDERAKGHPCGDRMQKYLNSRPEKRTTVWGWMQEDSRTDGL